jgi:hypothetical protein
MGATAKFFTEIRELEAAVNNEEIDALQAYIEIKELYEYVKSVKENIGSIAVKSFAKDGNLICYGYNIEAKQKTTWKYDHVEAWKNKQSELTTIENNLKQAYQDSQKVESSIDFETGKQKEVIINTEFAIPEYSKPFLSIKKVPNESKIL